MLYDHTLCLVAAIDGEQRIVAANPAFREVFGDGIGRRCYQVYKHRDQSCECCVAAEVFGQGIDRAADEQGITKDGADIAYRVHCIPVRGDDGQVDMVLQISMDTTAVRNLEQDLYQAERLAAVGLTTAGLAHTIKNILAGLEGATYLVESAVERDDPQRLRGGWEMVSKYIEQVSTLVKNLLRYAKAGEPVREDVEPAELVSSVVELYESKAGMINVAVEQQVAPELGTLRADREALHACLSTLVSNALDACTWDPDTDKDHRIAVSASPEPAGGVVFEVRDNGKGISEENQKRILHASFTTKGIRGTGLGLLLAKKAVREHGGSIEFSSVPGEGTTFRIHLPAAHAAGSHGSEHYGSQPTTNHLPTP